MKQIIPATLAALFSLGALATELPNVPAPRELTSGEFAEGTVTQLTEAEVAEFLPWAQNARNTLNRALTQARSLPLRDRRAHIERAVEGVVRRSGSRQYQMRMRFALNRGMLLVDELERHVDMNSLGAQENALDILQRSIAAGLAFYETDLAFQRRTEEGNTSTVVEYARFGASYMRELYPAVLNVLDASAQYRLLYKLIEMVNWDLSRDAEAASYSEIIVEAYELLQGLPQAPERDDRANLRMIRRLHSLRIIGAEARPSRRNNSSGGSIAVGDLPSCVQSLSSSGMGGQRALLACRQESSSSFVHCTTSLMAAGTSSTNAVAACLHGHRDSAFPGCVASIMGLGFTSASSIESCQHNSAPSVHDCTQSLISAGVSSSMALNACRNSPSSEFISCVTGLTPTTGGRTALEACGG